MSLSLRIPSLCPIEEIVTLHPKSIKDDSSDNVVQPDTSREIESSNEITEPTRCYVCAIHPGQYTCPRCHIPYCSVNCYQRHGVVSSSKNDTDHVTNAVATIGNSSSGCDCIEHFYEQRVSQILQLEVKEQSQQFKRKLMNHKISYSVNEPIIHTDSNRDRSTNVVQNTDDATEQLSREELQQVWSILERIEDTKQSHAAVNDVTTLQQTLQQHCSIRVQNVIQRAMHKLTTTVTTDGNDDAVNADILHKYNESITEWILEPWSPWWCRNLEPFRRPSSKLESQIDEEDDDMVEESDRSTASTFNDTTTTKTISTDPTFDERLMSIPKFETLYRMRQCCDGDGNDQRLQQFPSLQYNLIDILFAIVYTLRTFHGVKNVVDDIAIDAATTLVNSSLVLQQDQRYTNLESVLLECTNINHPLHRQLQYYDNRKNSGNNLTYGDTSFQILQDVALIYKNHRYVARALMEASDILQVAITELKRVSKGTAARSTTFDSATIIDMRHQLRRRHQKIIFYVSWTMAISAVKTSAVPRGWPYKYISTDIRLWIEGWQLPAKINKPSIQIAI